MSGTHDDSLVLDDIVDAAQRLVELGGLIAGSPAAPAREIADQVLWNLTVLGEAVKRLPVSTREVYPDVPWGAMAGTRDVVVHHYEGIDWEVITNIITRELPRILPRLCEIATHLRAGSCADEAPVSDCARTVDPHA